MTYQEYDALPAYRALAKEDDLNPLPQWSHIEPPPPIGATIKVTINQIGPAVVLKYFTEQGYLGVLVNPLAPPEWYVRQNGYNTPCHMFGAEIGEKLDPAPLIEGPNIEQLAALQEFSEKYGRNWKRKLEAAWLNGSDVNEKGGPLLRQVRTQHLHWLRSAENKVVPRRGKERRI